MDRMFRSVFGFVQGILIFVLTVILANGWSITSKTHLHITYAVGFLLAVVSAYVSFDSNK